MELVFEIAGDQIDGARDYQEDAFMTTYLDDEEGESKSSALVIMADGMGGHAAGNIASNMVVSTFNKSFTGRFGKEEIPAVLRESLEKANGALHESIKETPALDGMGCTMVTAALSKSKVFWVSVGDSHLYLIRDKELTKKNDDHSYGGYLDRMREQGIEVEAEPGLSRNMLMSAMTGEEIAEIDCPKDGFQLLPGDRLVVCSDGLDTLTPAVVLEASAWAQTAKECVDRLLKSVEEANKPRQDNTTVIVVDAAQREYEEPPAPPQPPAAVEATPEPAAPAAAPAVEEYPEEEAKKGGKGMLLAIAAVLVLAIGGGAFFMLGGKQEAAPTQVAEAPATATETESSPTEPEPEPEPEPATTTEPEAAPEPESQTQIAAVSEAESAAASAAPAVAAAEFQDDLSSGGKGPVMVSIPAGPFKMGSSGLSPKANEVPQHDVSIQAFSMSKYEVTFTEYEAFATATGKKLPDNKYMEKDTHPVIFVNWDDAYNYAKWLSKETGKKYRLPTEAEWEYAARGNTDTPYWWGYEVGENNAHCFDCKTPLNPRLPTSVGRFKANPFGLFDTAGNVEEWVHDCYHPNYSGAPDDGSIWEGGDCTYRIARGGSYSSPPQNLRSPARAKRRSTNAVDTIGIRVVREP